MLATPESALTALWGEGFRVDHEAVIECAGSQGLSP